MYKLIQIILFWLFYILSAQNVFPQDIEVRGKVTDFSTGESLGSVLVVDRTTSKGTTTNSEGIFETMLSPGKHKLEFSFLGFQRLDTILFVSDDIYLKVSLIPSTFPMSEITVTGERRINRVSTPEMGTFSLSNTEMRLLPALLGETDPLKILQLTPGIQSSSGGGAGFFVRGGGVDQNSILYDNTLIYNAGHLLGIFSVFNSDFIENATIINSGIPANYGGKASSVIKLSSYKGNSDSVEVRASLGIIFSRLSVNGPALNKKATFNIGIRRTYIGLVVKPIMAALAEGTSFMNNENIYNFHDFNAGFSWEVSPADHLTFTGYYGRDNYRIIRDKVSQESNLSWGNGMGAIEWRHTWSGNAAMKTSFSWTKYDFNFAGKYADYSFGLTSAVEDLHLKNEYSLNRDRNQFLAGFEITEHHFLPGALFANSGEYNLNLARSESSNALEGGVFLQHTYSVAEKFSVSGGLRYSYFIQHGPNTSYIRDGLGQISDSIEYNWNESLAFYNHLEPRLVLKYHIDKDASVKASYMHIAQYVHLATSSSASLPLDIWIPASREIRPMIGDQVSVGYYKNFRNPRLEFSTELYYKKFENKLEFLRGIIFSSLDGNFTENIVQGFGRAYGLEFYLSGEVGKNRGWISYALSRTENSFEEINEGAFFPAKYDRTHDVSLTFMHDLNKKWSASAVFVYITGNAYTMPVSRYIIQGNVYNRYGEVNSFRLPANHRLDLSMKRRVTTPGGIESELVFTVYNAYNHANPFYIYYEVTGGELENYRLKVEAFQVNLLPIMPSVSWNIVF